jgi:hypothetical protein
MDRRKSKPKVLIVCHADGYVQAFSREPIDIHIATMPDVSSQHAEILAEAIVDQYLPYRMRDIHYPGYVRQTHIVRSIDVADLADRIAVARDIETLRRAIDGRSRRAAV